MLDRIVDGHFPILNELEDRLERLTSAVLDEGQPASIGDIMRTRRDLTRFRRALSPQRDVLMAMARREHALISDRSLLYFRDVSDHLMREYESTESLREMTASVMEIHLAVNEREQNTVVKKLTIISAVFLPLNFVSGLFGMNFEHMPFGDDRFLFAALVSMVALPVAMLAWFARRNWI